MTRITQNSILIDKYNYRYSVLQKKNEGLDAPRLVIVSYQANEKDAILTKLAVRSIRKFTLIPHEIWVVDNSSPKRFSKWMAEEPDLNVIWNKRYPVAPRSKNLILRNILETVHPTPRYKYAGYANGFALQLAAKILPQDSKLFGVFHNDILACKSGWLTYLFSKLQGKIKGSAVATHRAPSGQISMSASGFIFDFRLFHEYNMSFLPNMPLWDAAENISYQMIKHKNPWFVARNTRDTPELIDTIPSVDPAMLIHSDRSFDDEGDIFFMHLGRGTVKTAGKYTKPGRTSAQEWIDFAVQQLEILL